MLTKAGEVILCNNKAKNVDIAIATARLFNEVSVQKNKSEWARYYVTIPKVAAFIISDGDKPESLPASKIQKQMARKLDKIVVVDIESTCWEGKAPDNMQSDIIEIGICLLDVRSGEITENRGILVKPERSEISSFCTQLTTITPKMIEQDGIPFKESLKILREEYYTQSRAWASFGAYDLNQFREQCTALEHGYPFGPSHINVKTLFALKKKLGHETGMAGALEKLGIPLDGTHHRGVDDARNIAKILWWILSDGQDS